MHQPKWLIATWLAGATVVNGTLIDRIVARVNSDVITAGDVTAHEDLGERIDRMLLIQRGRDLGISVEGDVLKRVAEAQKVSGLADADAFHAWFFQQTGVAFEEWKRQISDAAMTERVISQEVTSRIVVPNFAVDSYYENHRAEFVRIASLKLRETLIAADRIGLNLTTAEARRGTELPPIPIAQLSEAVISAIAGKERGEVSSPVPGADGYRVYYIEEKIAGGQSPLNDVRNEITDRLYREKLPPALRAYLGTLRKDAFLQIREGYADSNAAAGKDTAWKDPAMLLPDTTTAEQVRLRKKGWFRVTK